MRAGVIKRLEADCIERSGFVPGHVRAVLRKWRDVCIYIYIYRYMHTQHPKMLGTSPYIPNY